jgi:hypothetical protein
LGAFSPAQAKVCQGSGHFHHFRVKQNDDPALRGRFPKTPLPFNRLLAVDLEAATAGYPPGNGRAMIFRSMPVNSRRVKVCGAACYRHPGIVHS